MSAEKRSAFTAAHANAPCIVIDAGHGGSDGGAVSLNGINESAVNLSVALKSEQLLALFGKHAMMTRSSETIDYPPTADTIRGKKVYDQKRRLEMINSSQDNIFLSIHQNYSDARYARGPQVLYGALPGSRELAEDLQASLDRALFPGNKRGVSAASGDLFLFKNAKVTAVLVECGFLSNPEDERNLTDDGYQIKIAASLLEGICRFFGRETGAGKY